MPHAAATSLSHPSPKPGALNRRDARRYPYKALVSYRVVATRRSSWLARVGDLSQTGLALLIEHQLESGLMIMIELEDLAPQMPQILLARVRHCTRQANNRWLIGCEFARSLSEKELQLLIGQPATKRK